MRQLLYVMRSRSVEKSVRTIVAAAVIHNICLMDLEELRSFLERTEVPDLHEHSEYDPPLTAREEDEMSQASQDNSFPVHESMDIPECISGRNLRDSMCRSLATSSINPEILEEHDYGI